MRVVWKIDGPWYHDRKKEFKEAREKYGHLVYKGFQDMGWKSEYEEIWMDVIRVVDEKTGREYTKELTLTWEGDKPTKLFAWMKEFFKDFELDPLKEKLKDFDEETRVQIELWMTTLNRPPDGYINAYKKDRAKKREELIASMNCEETVGNEPPEAGVPVEEIFKDGE